MWSSPYSLSNDNIITMDKKEFQDLYATNSRTTWDKLSSFGLVAVPCDCGDPSCKGWKVIAKQIKEDKNTT